MKASTIGAAVVAGVIAITVAACGSSADTSASAPTTPLATTTTVPAVVRPTTDVDELVRIDSGQMHLRCTGAGDTTVVLIAGWDGGDGAWDAVAPSVSQHARVCSYAKFGTGSSDAAPTVQTFASQADDLHALLAAAHEPGPYVVLGHSFGGAAAVTFASKYPDEVTGLLLLDASPTTWPTTVCTVPAYKPACDLYRNPAEDAERLDVFRAFDEVARITTLGDLPMTVVTGVHRDSAGLNAEELSRLDSLWADGQQHWSSLSSASSVVTVEHTGHHIEIDQPQQVVDELLKLLP